MAEQGRVRWKRFALIFTPVVAMASLLVGATAQGAIGASFVVAGSTFKLFAGELRAQGFTLAEGVVHDIKGRTIPVIVTGIGRAQVTDLCQSAVVKSPLGAVTVTITGGLEAPVTVENMVIDTAVARADATINDLELGRDASTLDVPAARGPAGTFGAQGRTVTLRDVRLTAWAVTAATFRLPDLKLSLRAGEHECF
ncbi:DUF6230 family protein [Nonomuraea sp. NPDC059194]|uniref:DUF6230 family protein n=1 Tax=Nonomuraea sp. NPDC059194 TaxID=3346764 RepID=UPI0036A61AF3